MKAEPISIPQLEHIWDVALGATAQLVYLWHCDSVFDADTTLMINLIVSLGEVRYGSYPHTIALDWIKAKHSLGEVRDYVRMGFPTADSVPVILKFDEHEGQPLKLVGDAS